MARHEYYRTRRVSRKTYGNDPTNSRRRKGIYSNGQDRIASESEFDGFRERWIIPRQSESGRSFRIITIDPRSDTEADQNNTDYFNRQSKYYRGRERVDRTYRYLYTDER